MAQDRCYDASSAASLIALAFYTSGGGTTNYSVVSQPARVYSLHTCRVRAQANTQTRRAAARVCHRLQYPNKVSGQCETLQNN